VSEFAGDRRHCGSRIGGLGSEREKRASETIAVVARDHKPGYAGTETLGDALGIVSDRRQPVGLRFNEKIREGLARRGVYGDIRRRVQGGRIAMKSEKLYARRELFSGDECFARGSRRPVARQPELPIRFLRKFGNNLDQLALIFLGPKHGHAQENGGRCGRAVTGAKFGYAGWGNLANSGGGGREDQRIVDDGDFFRRELVLTHECVAGFAAVCDDAARQSQRASEQPRKFFSRAHRGEHRGVRMLDLQSARVAVRHSAHAKNDVRLEPRAKSEQPRRKPIEPHVKRLQHTTGNFGVDGRGEGTAGTKREEGRPMAGGGKGVGQKHGLPLGPAAAKMVLDNEDFHCPVRRPEDSLRRLMNSSLNQLLVRWLVLALGVVLATRLVNGISYDTGATLLVVVLLLSLFNAILKPLLVLFTLPFIVVTMGLGVVLINAMLFLWVGKLVDGFNVAGFGAAVKGAIVVSLTNWIVSALVRSPKPVAGPGTPPSSQPAPPKRSKDDDVIDI
jgi:putative membrane protein